MRIIHLSTLGTILLDIFIWFIIHMGVVYGVVRIPLRRFDPRAWPFRPRRWERGGDFYERYFRIKKWKKYLPDGAPLLGSRGFPKKRLQKRTPEYLRSFLRETCRAELTHWLIVFFAPFFFFWNPLWVGFFMILYALAENLPLILAQRYNRARLRRVLKD